MRSPLALALAAALPFTAGAAVSRTFRQNAGVPAYNGTTDCSISQELGRYWDQNENYDRTYELAISGNPVDIGALLRFDISAIPSTATVTAVTLTFHVLANGSGFSVYELKKDFVETEATWNLARAGVPWETPGATGPTDRGAAALGTYAAPGGATPYSYTMALNAAGVAVVQGWVSTPSNNHGLVIADYLISGKARVASSEDAAAANHPILIVTYTLSTVPATMTFQDGVSPTAAYAGTRDVSIGNGAIVNINGNGLRADGYEEDSAALIRFDVSAIPPWSTVNTVSLDGYVTDTTSQTYPIYELLRPWSDTSATLLGADATTPWSLRGALSTGTPAPADHGATVLGLWIGRTANAFNSVTLNRLGAKAVQDWVRANRPNYGFIIQDYADATSDGVEWDEAGSQEQCDTAVPPNCLNASPGLTVTYNEGRFGFISAPQKIRVGAPSAPLTIQRQRADDGVPIAAGTAPSLGVTLRSSSTGGAFSLSPAGPWSPTLSVTIPAAASDSQPFYYRDALAGSPTLTASLPAAWVAGTQSISVGSLMLADDVESGQVLAASGGQWSQSSSAPSCSIGATPVAAHRGSFGLRVTDGDGQPGPGAQSDAEYLSAPVGTDLYFRTWFRYSGSNQIGDAQLAAVGAGPLASMSLSLPAAALNAAGIGADGGISGETGTAPVSEGSWHLLELYANNVGFTSGMRRTYVDGQLNTSVSGLDWSGLGADVIAAGEPSASDRRLTGTLDFDDLRASTSSPVSHFLVQAPATAALNACTPVTISLRDSGANALAEVHYDFSAALQLKGLPGTLYSDSGCSAPITSVPFPAGTRTVTVYVAPAAVGGGVLTASYADFLDGSDSFSVVTGQPLAVAPTPVNLAPHGAQGFTASGGSGGGYRWSLLVNRSGATLTPGGLYTAGATPEVGDVVQVTDSLGATATGTALVGRDYVLAPPRAVVFPGGSVNFFTSSPNGTSHYGVSDNRSGAVIDPLSGQYNAGGTGGVVDTVTAVDSRGETASAQVQVLQPSDVRLNVSGSGGITAGASANYTFQALDLSGVAVGLPQLAQVRVIPVPGGAPVRANLTSTFGAPDAGTPSGTNLTLLTNTNGAATATLTDLAAEKVFVCGALAANGAEACVLVTVSPGAAHHARVDAVPASVTSCAPARLDVSVVDVNENNVGLALNAQVCAAAASSAAPVSSTLANPVIAGTCVSGALSAVGTASVFAVDGMDETVTFTPSSPSAGNAPVTAQVTWSGRAPAPSQTLLELVGATDPAPITTAPGSSVQVHVSPRDACGAPISFPVASEVVLQLPPPLQASGPLRDATGFSFDVTSPECPPLPSQPLPIHASLSGAPVTTAGGAPAEVHVQVTCRAPRFTSQGATAARCNEPYHYSAAGAPAVDGDGPFAFRATGLPAGASLSPAGEILWVPKADQVGPYAVDLTVAGAAGTDTQTVNIDVTCESTVPTAPCGCQAAGAGPLAVAVLALLRRRRRRSRLSPVRR